MIYNIVYEVANKVLRTNKCFQKHLTISLSLFYKRSNYYTNHLNYRKYYYKLEINGTNQAYYDQSIELKSYYKSTFYLN